MFQNEGFRNGEKEKNARHYGQGQKNKSYEERENKEENKCNGKEEEP